MCSKITTLRPHVNVIYKFRYIKKKGCMWQEIPDWSKLLEGEGLDKADELLVCSCSFST